MTEESRQIPRGAAAKSAGTSSRASSSGGSRAESAGLRAAPDLYLVAATPPTDIRAVVTQLEQDDSCRVVRILRGPSGGPGVAVVEMTPEHAATLASYPGVHAEPDYPAAAATGPATGVAATTKHVRFEAVDDGGHPIEGAAVTLTGSGSVSVSGGLPVTGFTGADGRAEIVATPEALADAELAEIRPPRGCWPIRVRPAKLTGTVRATCTRITTTHPDFPERALDSWGARAMGFERLPPTYRGRGARIALIGSGAATGHPDLSGQIEHGRDLLGDDERSWQEDLTGKSWQEDLTGAGTHHATLVAGRDDGTGIAGLASEAETHICRVTPGGSAADLIEALDYCIEQQVDVAMFASCVAEYSALLAAKVDEAWQNGIVCIAAAGGFPAALPQVLAVGAIGQLGTFPPEGTDTASLTGQVSPEGFFVPRFTPAGPDCCAPGVAIISGLPPASYGPLSGTGTAAAHVTALAALILAHHPLFRPEPGRPRVTRDATRPARLLEVIKASCRPLYQSGLAHLDPARTGLGIPDAAVALGVAPWGAHPPLSVPYPAPPPGPDGRTSLEPLTAAMHAAGLLSP